MGQDAYNRPVWPSSWKPDFATRPRNLGRRGIYPRGEYTQAGIGYRAYALDCESALVPIASALGACSPSYVGMDGGVMIGGMKSLVLSRAVLASPLGFLIGVSLGALGGGGSILAVPALVYAAGQSPKAATTTSLVVVGAISLGGMVAHWRAGRVKFGSGLIFGLAGVGGSLVGSALNRMVNPQLLLLTFAGLMVVAAWRMVASQRARSAVAAEVDGGSDQRVDSVPGEGAVLTAPPRSRPGLATVVKVIVVGSIVGFMTGFFGVGGGFVVVPGLVLALGFEMPIAVGTSLLVIVVNTIVALSARLATSGIPWHVAIPFTVAGLLGVEVGNRLASKLAGATLVKWFAALLVALAAYTAIRSGLALF